MQATLLFDGQMQVNLEGDAHSLGVYQPIKTLSYSPVAGIIPKTKLSAINCEIDGDKTKKFKVCCKHMRKISIHLPEIIFATKALNALSFISSNLYVLYNKNKPQ